MPIAPIVLQRRLREIGRIRAGDQVTWEKNGKTGTRPRKLAKFRMTCTDRVILEAAAADSAIGGNLREWEGSPGEAQQWELYTDVAELEVFVPPGDSAFSQWLELWSAGGCQRRCTGEWELTGKEPRPCLCDPMARECEFHARLSLIIPSLPGLGVWRIETKGWYANQELAGAVEVCQALSSRGTLVPARLRLEPREVKRKDDSGKPITYKFIVPVLDTPTSIPIAQLMGGGTSVQALAETAQREVGSGFRPVPVAELPSGPQSTIAEQAVAVNDPTPARPRRNAQEPIPSTGMKPRTAGEAIEVEGAAGDPDGEPARSEPDAAAPPNGDGETVAQRGNSQLIARECREAGLDDDGRHRFLAVFSEGRYKSSKDVPTSDMNALRATIVKLKRGAIKLVEGSDGWALVDTDPADPPSGVWDAERWLARIASVAGVGQTTLLKKARELADTVGVESPASLDALVDPKLVEAVEAWLDERSAA